MEVIFVLLLVGLFLGITVVSLKDSISREGPRGLAYTVAEDLRAARAEAKRSGTLVAAVFSNQDGANPFSRGVTILKGDQRGQVHRIVSYTDEFDANIFTGFWGGDVEVAQTLPGDWPASVADGYALFFRPDGTAFSNQLPDLEGRYVLVTGSGFRLGGQTGSGLHTLSGLSHPYTVNVFQSGTISVVDGSVPGPALPAAAELPEPAPLALGSGPGDDNPLITDVEILPEKVEGLDEVGLGRTYVQIHPVQRTGDTIEYGLATFRIRAEDSDGGPLTYGFQVTPSSGSGGTFSHPGDSESAAEGRLKYVAVDPRDPSQRNYWEAVVAWRPPPGARPDTTYEFELTVTDPQGNSDVAVSGAELMPVLKALKPPRLLMETNAGDLFLGNMDGTSLLELTRNGPKERDPFFSSDGTRIYSFCTTGSGDQELIMRNADGTDRKALRTFPADRVDSVEFDPYKTFAAYLTSEHSVTVDYDTLVTEMVPDPDWSCTCGGGSSSSTESTSTGSESLSSSSDSGCTCGPPPMVEKHSLVPGTKVVSGHRLVVMHLNSGEEVLLAEYAKPDYDWYSHPRYSLKFVAERPYDDKDRKPSPKQGHKSFPPLPKDYIPAPGYEVVHGDVKIEGFPPRATPTTLPPRVADRDVANLAQPKWYLEWRADNDPSLRLVQTSTGFQQDLVTGEAVEPHPSWSGDGTTIVYAKDGGSGFQIFTKEVLEDDTFVNGSENLLYSASNISSPCLSDDGLHAFFLRAGDIWRLDLESGKQPINLTKLVPGIRSFALSR